MEFNFKDKIAVVTGGASGIGLNIAMGFAREGAKIAVCDISVDNLANLQKIFDEKGYTLFTQQVDVGNSIQMSSFAEAVYNHYGQIDIWVNNAGANRLRQFDELTIEDWNFVISTNLTSVFWGTHEASKYMRKNGGVILNTASYAALMPYSKGIPYSCTKAGIVSLTRSTAGVLAPYGIRVNAILPGTTETPIIKTRLADETYRNNLVSRIAMQRISTPEEMAKMYLVLASDLASYITGAAYEVTGGKLCIQDIQNPWDLANGAEDVKL